MTGVQHIYTQMDVSVSSWRGTPSCHPCWIRIFHGTNQRAIKGYKNAIETARLFDSDAIRMNSFLDGAIVLDNGSPLWSIGAIIPNIGFVDPVVNHSKPLEVGMVSHCILWWSICGFCLATFLAVVHHHPSNPSSSIIIHISTALDRQFGDTHWTVLSSNHCWIRSIPITSQNHVIGGYWITMMGHMRKAKKKTCSIPVCEKQPLTLIYLIYAHPEAFKHTLIIFYPTWIKATNTIRDICKSYSKIAHLSGWWFEPLWKILWVNWDDYSQYMGK